MPECSRLELVAVGSDLEGRVVSTQVDIANADEASQLAEVVEAETGRP
jgi:hypothetical protein